MTNPALEYVKMVCHVLSLDPIVTSEVARLKANLLRLVGVHEFAPEAQFVNPCLSYVLPDVICSHCGWGRDVDLCRDRFVTGHHLDDNLEWLCAHCNTPYVAHTHRHTPPSFADRVVRASPSHDGIHVCRYGRDSIEQRLVGIVQRASVGFQTQDLVCSRCRSVKADLMALYCDCSGQFKTEFSAAAFERRYVACPLCERSTPAASSRSPSFLGWPCVSMQLASVRIHRTVLQV